MTSLFVRMVFCPFLVILAAADAALSDAKLVRITPAGQDVQGTRQIVFQFDRGVVPVGRMERGGEEIPISFTPEVKCDWRWINTSTLACELGEETGLQLATRFRIAVKAGGAGTESGLVRRALEEFMAADPSAHEFITDRPRVSSSWFQSWSSPGQPQVYLAFNQEVSAASVRDSIRFTAPNGESVRAVVVPPKARGDHGEEGEESGPDEEQESGSGSLEEVPEWSRNYVVMPERELPLASRCQLSVVPGLKGQAGPERGIEERVVREFDTFPEFDFRGVRCCDTFPLAHSWSCSYGKEVTITPAQNSAACNPQERIALVFSSPVRKEVVQDVLEVTPDMKGKNKDYDPWASVGSWSRLNEAYTMGQDYLVYMPYGLKANQLYRLKAVGAEVKDEFGRSLAKDLDLSFQTSKRLPRLVYERGPSVLEKEERTHLPVAIQNLDGLDLQYDTLTTAGAVKAQRAIIPVDNVPDVSYHFPLKVRDLLKGGSGVVKGVLSSSPPALMGDRPDYFVSQVTPFNVHVKIGHFSSLVWVARLSDGSPVQNAKIRIFKERMDELGAGETALGEGTTDASGIARLPGLESIDPLLKIQDWWNPRNESPVLKVLVTRGEEMALVPLIYDLRLDENSATDSYIYASRAAQYGHIHTWGTTAQGIYKLGQPIDFKLYVRNQNDLTFARAPKGPYTLKVYDPTGKAVYEQKDIQLSDFGAVAGQVSTSEQGAVGWYRFVLVGLFAPRSREYAYGNQPNDEAKYLTWEPMQVLVSDFTPSTFKVSTEIKGSLFRDGDTVATETQARLHAGGPYANAPLRLTARIFPEEMQELDPKAHGFAFNLSANHQEPSTVHQSEDSVDAQGNRDLSFKIQGAAALYGRLEVESAVRDDRGKNIASRGTARYAGRDRYAGVKLDGWVHPTGQELFPKVVVVDPSGKLSSGDPVVATVSYLEVKAARVKGPGNAYLTQYSKEWKAVAECKLTSGPEPQACGFKPERPGSYRIEATVTDPKGQTHKTQIDTYAFGPGIVLWESDQTNLLEYPCRTAGFPRSTCPSSRGLSTLGERTTTERKNPGI